MSIPIGEVLEGRMRRMPTRVRRRGVILTLDYLTRRASVRLKGQGFLENVKVPKDIPVGTEEKPKIWRGNTVVVERNENGGWYVVKYIPRNDCAYPPASTDPEEEDYTVPELDSENAGEFSSTVTPDLTFDPPTFKFGGFSLDGLGPPTALYKIPFDRVAPTDNQVLKYSTALQKITWGNFSSDLCEIPVCEDCAPDGYQDGMVPVLDASGMCWKWGFRLRECYPPPPGLVGWWTGDDTPEDILNGNDGTLENGATYGTGKVESAFSFNRAAGSHVSLGNPDALKLDGSLTIDAWVCSASVPEIDDTEPAESYSMPYAIVTKWAQNEAFDSYGLWLHSPDGERIELIGGIGHPGFPDGGFTSGFDRAIHVGEWVHVAMTYDHITGANKLYINAQVVASRTQPGGTTASDTNVLIGREDSSLPRNFDGLIDEVEIFNRALTQEEIRGIFAAGRMGKCKDLEGYGEDDEGGPE